MKQKKKMDKKKIIKIVVICLILRFVLPADIVDYIVVYGLFGLMVYGVIKLKKYTKEHPESLVYREPEKHSFWEGFWDSCGGSSEPEKHYYDVNGNDHPDAFYRGQANAKATSDYYNDTM